MPRKSSTPSVHNALGNRMTDALFGLSVDFPKVVEVDLARIQPNPNQPRKTVDEAALGELVSSIEQHGLLQPVVIRELDEQPDRYVLVAGQRRLLAHQRLGRETIFAIVTKGDTDELALIENLQRQDLDPLEEAQAIARLMESHGYTQEQLGRVLGRKQNTVSEILSLTTLPEAIRNEYRTSDTRVSKSMLVELARVGDPEQQLALWRDVRRGGTIRHIRAKRKAEKHMVSPSGRSALVISTGRRFVRQLEQLPAAEITANRDHYEALIALRARIDELLVSYATEQSPAPERYRTSDGTEV